MLSLLLPNDDLREQVYDYIPLLLAEYQGSLEALFITQVRAASRGGVVRVEGGMSDILTPVGRPNICAWQEAVGAWHF